MYATLRGIQFKAPKLSCNDEPFGQFCARAMDGLLRRAAGLYSQQDCGVFQQITQELVENDQHFGDDLLFIVQHTSNDAQVHAETNFGLAPSNDEAQSPVPENFITNDAGPCGHTGIVQCLRRAAGLPLGASAVCWRQTFCLNVLAHLHCVMRVSLCETNVSLSDQQQSLPNLCARHEHRVYAEPARLVARLTENSWPFMNFGVHDYECNPESAVRIHAGQTLCIELMGTLSAKQNTLLDNSNSFLQPQSDIDGCAEHKANIQTYTPWTADNGQVLLFQGAVTHEALFAAYARKESASSWFGLVKSAFGVATSFEQQYILMRGPLGERHAQVAVTPAHIDKKPNARRWSFLFRHSALTLPESTALECRPMFVCIDWRTLIEDVFAAANT